MSSNGSFAPVQRRKQRYSKVKRPKTRKYRVEPDPFESVQPWNALDISGWNGPDKPHTMTSNAWDTQGRVDRLHSLVPYWWQGVLDAEEGGEPRKMENFFLMCEEEEKASGWGHLGDESDPWGGGDFPGWGDVKSSETAHKREVGGGGARAGRLSQGEANAGWNRRPGNWNIVNRASGTDCPEAPRSDQTAKSDDLEMKDGLKSGNPEVAVKKGGTSWDFVERIARERHASPERKQSMHQFYAVSYLSPCLVSTSALLMQFVQMPTDDKVKKIQEMVAFLRVNA